jgi:hypothetical protein
MTFTPKAFASLDAASFLESGEKKLKLNESFVLSYMLLLSSDLNMRRSLVYLSY